MLAREQCRRHDDGDLLALNRGGEGGAQRDLRLAEADVAADEPVHWPPGGHVVKDGFDRGELIFRLVIGKAGAEFGVEPFGRNEFRRRAHLPRGGDFDKPRRHFEDALAHARLALLPAAAAQAVELDLGVLGAVTREKIEVFDRQEQLGAFGVMQFKAVMRRAIGLDRLQADEAADAVVDMHDDVARRKRADLAQEILGLARRLAAAHEAVAENVLFADNDKIVALEAGF